MQHSTPSIESVPATALAKMMYCEHTVTCKEIDTPQSLKRKQDGVDVHTQFEEQLKQSSMRLPDVKHDSSGNRPGNLSLPIAIAAAIALALIIYFVI